MRPSIAVLLGLLALSGCGSSGRSATTSVVSTRQQFVAQGNAICTRADEKARGLTSVSKLKPESLAAAAALLTQTEAELEKLKPPPPSAAEFQRFLTLARTETKLVSELASAIRERNSQEARTIGEKLNGSASNRAASQLGLTVCAKEVG
jgi:hypothetical protein